MTPTPLPELPSSHLCQVLSRSKARLQRRVRLSEGVELAVWANVDDEVRYCQPGHHTLSVYLAGGEGSQLKARPEAMGAPGRICIFTPEDESHWLVRSPVQFLHLYVSDLAWAGRVVRMLDAEPRSRTLRAQIYGDDQAFHAGARALMQLDWQDPQQQLAADAIGQQLVDRLVLQSATPRQLQALQRPLGGLSAAMRRRVLAHVEAHLHDSKAVSLPALAKQACLSEFHFARMFRQSMGCTVHEWVLQQRLARARRALSARNVPPLAELALDCGFSSASHLVRSFRAHLGVTPTQFSIFQRNA
ncbi:MULTISPECIES: helix-turn-helix transcriptional regulator [Delftia]|jgi:AraC family transcriptional regulator|nr:MULTISPECIES: AraC family transcriptional regulator [Delftia]MCP4017407.1 helix-turn-helix transcriptional regulator [Delftia sp.]OLE94216.1 MAG: AraC family transcriptional regulator [Delftia sp. 13_1_40CM_3_66_6]MCP4513863.1 helix-turn-helix transcriptional regulator [Delftia sp.]OLE08462.1 MAG: AraC family transcriptional regulator [Delftia sp. 13_1_20CM_4_67_18]QPS72948.1 helix-turn-helix transcriptional regulator [Delftia acidovorans]